MIIKLLVDFFVSYYDWYLALGCLIALKHHIEIVKDVKWKNKHYTGYVTKITNHHYFISVPTWILFYPIKIIVKLATR